MQQEPRAWVTGIQPAHRVHSWKTRSWDFLVIDIRPQATSVVTGVISEFTKQNFMYKLKDRELFSITAESLKIFLTKFKGHFSFGKKNK